MARLEELTPGTRVRGVLPDRPVSVVQVDWHGTQAVTLTYKDETGRVANELLYRDDEARLEAEEAGAVFSFDGDAELFRLASEAHRISLAYLFDPYLAVHTSSLDPLPHQIEAVYGKMLPRHPLRFLLADDPGAGKTIMAGLYIKELIVRGDLERCLVVVPGSLVEQWQDELWRRFSLPFELVTRETIETSKSGNPFAEKDLVIARLDHIARNEEIVAKLQQTEWDLVIVDEAHKMSAHYFGNEVKETKRYKLGRALGELTRHLLLLTATPHQGKEPDFQLFMALLDGDRFEGKFRDGIHTTDTSDMMRRLVKEGLLKFDGTRLFPERLAYSVEYKLSEPEAALYSEVTGYVRDEMNRADRLKRTGEGRRGAIVGFALTTLQRRLASSPEAIYRSIERRRKRLENRVREEELNRRGGEATVNITAAIQGVTEEDLENVDELTDEEVEELEEELVDQASAAQTIDELKREIERLRELEALAAHVRALETDRKWEELRRLLEEEKEIRDPGGTRRKLIIFTEHRDTLNYLSERIRTLVGRQEAIVTIHGGMGREERRKAQTAFTQDKDVVILVATDAAGEGINLQRAHLLVNYDLPWNPNRIEQRFGRIHRIGQTEVCHMWNLVAVETREGEVFQRLLEKLEAQRQSLGGQVFDVLGSVFTDRSLRDLLIDAVRYGERPEVQAQLNEIVDETIGQRLKEAVSERALVSDVLSPQDVDRIREAMEEAEARRLQPHFIRAFFMEAFKHLGGRIVEREQGRYEITHVPADVRNRDRLIGIGAPLLKRYERVTFEKPLMVADGRPLAEFIAPGHPLLDATIDLILERYRTLLKQGSVLVDPDDDGEDLRLLLYLEHSIQDGRTDRHGNRRVVSKRLHFVELAENGEPQAAGYAPYLDYRPLQDDDTRVVEPLLSGSWLRESVEQRGLDYAIAETVPEHLAEVRRQTIDRVDRTRAAVKDRLTKEINYWDLRAEQLKQQELAGRQPRMNSGKARQRANELEARLKKRKAELDQEKQLSPQPPIVVGGAVVVPVGLFERLRGIRGADASVYAKLRERVERLAVNAVLAAERTSGREPTEMPRNNKGFDIKSRADGGELFFIEVKGRIVGSDTFTVTKSEILTGLNKPDRFILAIVRVGEDETTDVRYITNPFKGDEDFLFGVASVNYEWDTYFERGELPL
jgi:superfamily II DNA or RNA helicase